ncbi:hypothetical protein ABPG77_009778 [Micractinium sp. CCAP 211/92]
MVKRRKADGPAQSVPDEKEAVERAAKRRRGAREPSEAGDRRQGAEPGRKGLAPAAAAAAAVTLAASGRAQSDDGDSVSEGTSCGKNATGGWAARDVTPDSQAGDQKIWRGVKRRKLRWEAEVGCDAAALTQPGAAHSSTGGRRSRNRVFIGRYSSALEAARAHDRAAIAILGPEAAASSLNFPASNYLGERQRFGPHLSAFLLELGEAGKPAPAPARRRQKLQGERLQRALDALEAANVGPPAARRARAAPRRAAEAREAEVAAQRQADPAWAPPREPCGVCPACRQPWRTDLGGCLRLAAAKAAKHSEQAVVELLASEPAVLRAAHAATTLRQRAPTPSQQEKPGKREADQRGQDQQRQQQQEGPYALIEATTSPDLIWLEQPTRRDQAARPALAALQRAAIAPLRQQLALEEASFAAVLGREQHPAADPAAAAAGAQRGGAPAPSLVPPGEAAGDGRLRAAPPHDTFAQHEPSLAELVQLAALCRKSGVEVPLVPDTAGEALEVAEHQQRQLQRLLRRQRQRQRRKSADSGSAAGLASEPGGDDLEEEGATGGTGSEAEQSGAGTDGGGAARRCLLCGGVAHGRASPGSCPVLQMALAVPKPPEECPGCAHQEQPGCRQCLGGEPGQQARFQRSLARVQPWRRRAPWLDRLPPATRDLMLAAQDFCAAAVTDLDRPQAAWRCTPRALLAVGLLVEEAARRELAARRPTADAG